MRRLPVLLLLVVGLVVPLSRPGRVAAGSRSQRPIAVVALPLAPSTGQAPMPTARDALVQAEDLPEGWQVSDLSDPDELVAFLLSPAGDGCLHAESEPIDSAERVYLRPPGSAPKAIFSDAVALLPAGVAEQAIGSVACASGESRSGITTAFTALELPNLDADEQWSVDITVMNRNPPSRSVLVALRAHLVYLRQGDALARVLVVWFDRDENDEQPELDPAETARFAMLAAARLGQLSVVGGEGNGEGRHASESQSRLR